MMFLKSAGCDRPAYTPSSLHRCRLMWIDVGECCLYLKLGLPMSCMIEAEHIVDLKDSSTNVLQGSMLCFDLFQPVA